MQNLKLFADYVCSSCTLSKEGYHGLYISHNRPTRGSSCSSHLQPPTVHTRENRDKTWPGFADGLRTKRTAKFSSVQMIIDGVVYRAQLSQTVDQYAICCFYLPLKLTVGRVIINSGGFVVLLSWGFVFIQIWGFVFYLICLWSLQSRLPTLLKIQRLDQLDISNMW